MKVGEAYINSEGNLSYADGINTPTDITYREPGSIYQEPATVQPYTNNQEPATPPLFDNIKQYMTAAQNNISPEPTGIRLLDNIRNAFVKAPAPPAEENGGVKAATKINPILLIGGLALLVFFLSKKRVL